MSFNISNNILSSNVGARFASTSFRLSEILALSRSNTNARHAGALARCSRATFRIDCSVQIRFQCQSRRILRKQSEMVDSISFDSKATQFRCAKMMQVMPNSFSIRC